MSTTIVRSTLLGQESDILKPPPPTITLDSPGSMSPNDPESDRTVKQLSSELKVAVIDSAIPVDPRFSSAN